MGNSLSLTGIGFDRFEEIGAISSCSPNDRSLPMGPTVSKMAVKASAPVLTAN
jgi:hypothetical protein